MPVHIGFTQLSPMLTLMNGPKVSNAALVKFGYMLETPVYP